MFLDHSTNTIYGIRSEYHLWYEGGLSRSSLRKVRFRLDDFAFRVILLSAAEGGGGIEETTKVPLCKYVVDKVRSKIKQLCQLACRLKWAQMVYSVSFLASLGIRDQGLTKT